MENDTPSATVEPPVLGEEAGISTAPTVYLSARGQDTALVAAVVKARLESQGCLVQHGSTEVRTRSQCAKYYGPLLHDCDVFIQLVGVDPGPVLSTEEDDDFWSLQIWEAREAARRKKPARHYLLDEAFCRMMLPETKRPPQVLKKQQRHRRKLASSPAKVRQVRDADELLRLLPIIRLAGESPENCSRPVTADSFNAGLAASLAALAAQATSGTEPSSRDAGMVSEIPVQEASPAPEAPVPPSASTPVEAKAEEAAAPAVAGQVSSTPGALPEGVAGVPVALGSPDQAAAQSTPAASPHGKPAAKGEDAFAVGAHGVVSPLPALPELESEGDEEEDDDDPVPGTPVRFENRHTDLPHPLPEVSLFNADAKSRKTVWVSLPHAFVLETGFVLPPIPALPSSSPDDRSAEAEAGGVTASSTSGDAPPAAGQTDIQPGIPVAETSPEVLPVTPTAASEIASGETSLLASASKAPEESIAPLAAIAASLGIDEPVVVGSTAPADASVIGAAPSATVEPADGASSVKSPRSVSADLSLVMSEEAGTKGADAPEISLQAPSTAPTAATAVVMGEASPAPVDEQPDLPKESAVGEPSLVPKEKMEIEARASRMEIVAQAPMKLELCRIEGHRVSVRPYALERRGLPRRGLPAWMLKKSADHGSPIKPVAGRRAYAKPSPGETAESQDESEQPFEETLFIPHRPIVRKYQHHRFIIFRITDSVSVRRLGEASKKRPGVAIATVIGLALLVGLLAKVAVGFFSDGASSAVDPVASNDPALAAPSRLDVSAENRTQNAAKPQKPGLPGFSPREVPVLAAITPGSVKAGADSKPAVPESAPATASAAVPVSATSTRPLAPAPVGNLDEQQKALEKELEEAILAMRNGSSAAMYARQHEAAIIDLQRKIQELIPVRSGHGFSGSDSSLALSRCLASVHLLGGRRQAARNALLDMRDTISASRSTDDPEIRLADYLLKRTEASSVSSQAPSPLTPGEMKALLAKLAADPQWEPNASAEVVGGP